MADDGNAVAGELLRRSAERWPARTAVVDRQRACSYRELENRAQSVAAWLVDRGLGPGQRLAVLSGNCLDYAVLIFAAARCGAVLVHLSLRAHGAELERMLQDSGASVLFLGPGASVESLPATSAPALEVLPLDRLSAEVRVPAGALPLPEATAAYAMTYTGGTTGRPKGVLVSHRARAGQASIIARAFGMRGEDVIAVATPLFHVAGLFVWFQPAIAVGATCILLDGWDPERFLATAEARQVTLAMLVPTQLIDLLRRGIDPETRLRSLRRIVYAGAPMPAAVRDELMARLPWIEFIENYGQSELGAVTVRRGADLPARAGSIGRALPGLDLAIMRPDGMPAATGEAGELVCRGPNHLLCYDNDPAATRALYPFGGDWLATGDIAVMDADGFVTLVDRAKDMIISGAENIYPVEIENILHRHPAVAECAVVGRPDERLGEVPVAYVVRRAGGTVDAEALIAHCLAALPRHKRPRAVEFLAELPKTAIGKVQKNLLRERG